jgi:hypothetical protein
MPRRLYVVRLGETKENVVARYSKAVWCTLAESGFVNRNRVACVGFSRDANDGSLILSAPKAYLVPEDGQHGIRAYDVFQLVRVFRKARRDRTTPIERGLSTQGTGIADRANDATLDFLDAALYLRDDYRRHGLYRRKCSVAVRNAWSYPVDWKRTIDSSPPYLRRSEVVLPETMHRARLVNDADLLRRLQASAVCDAFRLSGENVTIEPQTLLTRSEWDAAHLAPAAFMRRAQHGIYDDRGRKLGAALQAYLGIGGVSQALLLHEDPWFSYTAEFEYIWEAILRSLFCPNQPAARLPVGRWYPYPIKQPLEGIAPTIEIRVQTPAVEALVDAKDYGQDLRVINGFTWNGTQGDFYKQVIYRLLLTASERKRTVNILAFPGSLAGQLFQVRGCHVWPSIESSHVFEVMVDYDLAVRHWLGEDKREAEREVRVLINALQSAEADIISDGKDSAHCEDNGAGVQD